MNRVKVKYNETVKDALIKKFSYTCLVDTYPSTRDATRHRMPASA